MTITQAGPDPHSPRLPDPDLPLRPPVFHILLALSRADLHGLGIADEVERATAGAIELGPGTLYRSLKEMTDSGLVVPTDPPGDGADPRRKYYRISDRGRDLVSAEAARLERLVELARKRDLLPGTPESMPRDPDLVPGKA